MKVQVGTYAGFCFGVDRAVQLVEEAAKAGGTVVTLGPIIHNRHVVDRFARMGVEVVEDPSAVPAGSTVILRAHGVPRQVEEALAQLPVRVVDATCPFVAKIHRLARRAGSPAGAGGGGGRPRPRDHRDPHPSRGGGDCQLVPAGCGVGKSGGIGTLGGLAWGLC